MGDCVVHVQVVASFTCEFARLAGAVREPTERIALPPVRGRVDEARDLDEAVVPRRADELTTHIPRRVHAHQPIQCRAFRGWAGRAGAAGFLRERAVRTERFAFRLEAPACADG